MLSSWLRPSFTEARPTAPKPADPATLSRTADLLGIRIAPCRIGGCVRNGYRDYGLEVHLCPDHWQALAHYLVHHNRPRLCRDCRYFHGEQGLVCAVHPQGPSGTVCRDKEI
ncbi:hypothetical protein [Candidatus Cyanaurora vandensis]|uniref:hypothetical protein n=1 Tax=Candidatus Cyanaurora vandensis TaxID=2714958 RepID=UPI002580BABD|nr:hypothetical protein [Candidatus Cyanaurora vandensis]